MQTRRRVLLTLPGALVAAALPGCAQRPATTPATDAGLTLQAAIAAGHRSAANRARDAWRHPLGTLQFFGLRPEQTVVELAPGGGWYSEILAPYLRAGGRFFAAHYAADSTKADERQSRVAYQAKLAQDPALYDRVTLGTLPRGGRYADITVPGGADLVLSFRNVHNWVQDGSLDALLRATFALLKPGGTFGVVDHRAAPGTPLADMHKSGYITEALMEAHARAAGFVLAAKSEINANPRDTKDHADGVWALPPNLRGKDRQREHFIAIGESDRFTHRYVKPA